MDWSTDNVENLMRGVLWCAATAVGFYWSYREWKLNHAGTNKGVIGSMVVLTALGFLFYFFVILHALFDIF